MNGHRPARLLSHYLISEVGLRIRGITSRRFRRGWEAAPSMRRRWDAADLVCLVGWHFWGRWDKPTVAADRIYQQRVCSRCGRAQVREIG